ncbi:MAG: valine--tRNA ligase, partial [Gemmatimonadetes bacterium]|nr:valine--tRNA ligase [Gemmatimonadota bacterium]
SVYLDWLENVRDWCISRQLWWGHRIPVWYDEDGEPVASVDELEVGSPHPRTGKPIVRQDPDVLDTWASSWLWPFATLGWPERTDDLARFYPTHFLSTAREIIYLWVARMVMAGYELLDHLPEKDRCPFDLCYINPTVLDGQGRRMSKSLGNGIDPIEMIDRYGADAVRYSLMVLGREGQDVKLSENRFELGQRFANKIWNASRFVIRNLEGKREAAPGTDLEDEWIRSRLARVTEEVSAALTEYRFHDACQELYRFLWNDYCDWYLEVVKGRLAGEAGEASAARARGTLLEALRTVLALLHPIMPFLTEEIHRFLPGSKGLLMQSAWPTADPAARNLAAEGAFEAIQDVVSAVRNLRSRMSLPPSAVVSILVKTDDATVATALCESEQRIMALAGAKGVQAGPDVEKPAGSASALAAGGTVFVPLEGLIDLDVERARLGKERGRLENLVLQTERKLGNEQFVSRAKPEIVEREREKLGSLKADLERVAGAVADLG